MFRPFLFIAALLGGTGVGLGAFAAHGLRHILNPRYLEVFQTGVHYQMLHALALLGVALLTPHIPSRLLNITGVLFTLAILLFSGSLYLMTLTGVTQLGIITPCGGVLFLAAWSCLAVCACKARTPSSSS